MYRTTRGLWLNEALKQQASEQRGNDERKGARAVLDLGTLSLTARRRPAQQTSVDYRPHLQRVRLVD